MVDITKYKDKDKDKDKINIVNKNLVIFINSLRNIFFTFIFPQDYQAS